MTDMRKIIYGLLLCLLPTVVHAQQTSDVIYEIKRTLEAFSTDLNNINQPSVNYKSSLEKISLYGPQVEPRVFTHNGTRPGSLTRWIEAYVTDSLMCMAVSHTFDINEGSLKKASRESGDRRYTVDALMTWEYINRQGEIMTRRSPVSFTVIYNRRDKWVEITGINGNWPSLKKEYRHAKQFADDLYHQEEYAQAVSIYERLAGQGHAAAQNLLGYLYYNGFADLPKDYLKAFEFYKAAALQGHAQAQYHLGFFYFHPKGTQKRDYHKAVEWFRKATAQGEVSAHYYLGWCYANGEGGLPKDLYQAIGHYTTAAEGGIVAAMTTLAECYAEGKGDLSPDPHKAAELYAKAAEQGSSEAQYELARFYEQGKGGLFKDSVQAARLLQQSASQNYKLAQWRLAGYYEKGIGGLPKDTAKARELKKQGSFIPIRRAVRKQTVK